MDSRLAVGRLWTGVVALAVGAIVVSAPTATSPDRKPPRIVAAAMLDVNGNSRADRVRLTYSEPVKHVADGDGRFPFVVTGYRVRAIGPTRSTTLVLLLVEKATADPEAAPAVRYVRTPRQPVRDRAGNQAVAQLFGRTTAHGHVVAP